jgi:hypothetical protein
VDDTHLPTYAKPARGKEYGLFSPPNDREKVIAKSSLRFYCFNDSCGS